MCGRFALSVSPEQLMRYFALARPLAWVSRYNVAPTDQVPVVYHDPAQGRLAGLMPWGFTQGFGLGAARMGPINARAETVAERPTFRDAFRVRRCVVPMSGYYEWQLVDKRKQPHYITVADEGCFAVAGLYQLPQPGVRSPHMSFCIITVNANARIRAIHDRMPAILDPTMIEAWLDPTCQDPASLQAMLTPFDASRMQHHPVGAAIGQVGVEGASLTDVAAPGTLALQMSLFDPSEP